MKTKIPKGLYLVPFLYIAVIAVFVYLQFSGFSTFSSKIAHLTLSGEISRSPWASEDKIENLQIFGTGIVFTFDRNSPIRIQTKDGLVHKEVPQSYRPIPGGMVFEMGSSLSFTVQQDPDVDEAVRLSLKTLDPGSIRSLALPFQLMREFALETAGGLPVFSIHNKVTDEVTVLGLPMGAVVDPVTQRIILIPEENGFGDMIVEKSSGEAADPYAYWFSRQRDLLSKSDFDQFVENYLGRAIEGWQNERFDRQSFTWETRGEERGFNELAAAALLTESYGKREFNSLYDRIETAAEQTVQDLGLATAPTIGDIVVKADHQRRESRIDLENLLDMIYRGEGAVFQNPDLYFLVTGFSPEGPPVALKELAAFMPVEEIDPATAAGMFAFYLACVEEEGKPWPEIARFTQLPETVLLPSIKVTREGFFLVQEDKANSILLSLEVGALMIRSGELLNRDIHSTLGRQLIHSALMLGDQQGYLPGELYFEDGEAVFTESLAPEEFYPLLTEKQNLPRIHSFYRELGPGRWVYSNARRVEAERNDRTETYTFTAPAGETHYFLIQGVEPGFRLRLLGINWNPDPIFQYYYSGWYYDENSRSLLVKLKHRQEREEVILTYPARTQAPAVPTPLASTEPAPPGESENP